MNRSGTSFCPCCWNEFETAGPEIHLPDCKAMLAKAYYYAAKLGYTAKDEVREILRGEDWDRDDRPG